MNFLFQQRKREISDSLKEGERPPCKLAEKKEKELIMSLPFLLSLTSI